MSNRHSDAGPTPPLTLVVGGEALLRERAVSAGVCNARAEDPDVEVGTEDAADLTVGALDELTSPSLFATRRHVVLTGVDMMDPEVARALAERLQASAAAGDAQITVVAEHPGGVKGKKALDILRAAAATVVRCDPITRPDDLVAFVRTECRRLRAPADEEAAARLVQAVGNDLRALAAACHQLASDAEHGRVDAPLVETYFEGRHEVKGWTIADRAVEGRTDAALTELRWALSTGTDPVLVVGALAQSLRSLAMVAPVPRTVRDADVARDLSVPTWKVQVLRRQLRGWDQRRLATALEAVAAADRAVKGGRSDSVLSLTTALLAVCAARG